jgi:hypothetical protein
MASYPARFLKYPHHRGLADTANRKASWATARGVSLGAIPNLTGMASDRPGKTGSQPAVGGLARRIEIGGCWRITCSATLEWNSLPAPR